MAQGLVRFPCAFFDPHVTLGLLALLAAPCRRCVMHKLLEEVVEVPRLFIPELVRDNADLERRRHAQQCPGICEPAFDDELMHRHSELFLEGTFYCFEFKRKFRDDRMQPELHMSVMLVDEVLHGPRRMLQQHLVELVVRPQPPRADLCDCFAFTVRELIWGGSQQKSFLSTAVGHKAKQDPETPLLREPEPYRGLFSHGVVWVVRGVVPSAFMCADEGIAASTRIARQGSLFSARRRSCAMLGRQGTGLWIGGTASAWNKCCSHGHSSSFSHCSKLQAFKTKRGRARLRVKRFSLTSKGDYAAVRDVNNWELVVTYTKRLLFLDIWYLTRLALIHDSSPTQSPQASNKRAWPRGDEFAITLAEIMNCAVPLRIA